MAIEREAIDIAPFIDHSLLDSRAGSKEIAQWCEEADRYHFAAVCVYPSFVREAAERLHGRKPKVCTVIGFPTGATTSATKRYEAQEAVDNGAEELDIVINLAWLKAGKYDDVHREIAEICEETGVTVKAILETTLLSDGEKREAARLCLDAGAAFLKTSTGWHGGATVADVRLLKEVTRDSAAVKASGGIRSHDAALDLIAAGATRLGTSRGVDLLRQREESGRS